MIIRGASARYSGLDKEGEGLRVSKPALTLTASMPGIGEEEFGRIADEAKESCPISKLLNAEVTPERGLD